MYKTYHKKGHALTTNDTGTLLSRSSFIFTVLPCLEKFKKMTGLQRFAGTVTFK